MTKTLTLAILLMAAAGAFAKQPKPATYPLTGHVEWAADGLHPDLSVTVTMPSGNQHTVDCDGNVCSIDSLHGAVTIVLADGTRLPAYGLLGTESEMLGPFNHGTNGLYSAAMTASHGKVPIAWPTFHYRLDVSSKCAYVACGSDDVSIYLPRTSPDPVGVHPELEYHVTR
jgi:hypothetical protein